MKPFLAVPRVTFGRSSFNSLSKVVDARRSGAAQNVVYIVDEVFQERELPSRIPLEQGDRILFVNVEEEPKTRLIDELVAQVRGMYSSADQIVAVVGIGGGSTLDICKAVSILLTNGGRAEDYQGWDLVERAGKYKIGVPTLSGTGAEVSRTCVLTSETKKQGINSVYSIFDELVLDPELLKGISDSQRFFTAMDCYIHSVESLRGTFINGFSRAFAEKARDMCVSVFLDQPADSDEKLMMASYFGGCSIVYSEVGICHALSYGLSFVFGYHHGIANCIVFDKLEKYYPDDLPVFREMVHRNNIEIPSHVLAEASDEQLKVMTSMAYMMEKPLRNALGDNWRSILTPEVVRELYRTM